MKKNITLFLIFLIGCFFSTNSFATKFYSKNNGNWTAGNSWNNGGAIPTSNDTVYINGHSITVNSNVDIKRIELTNTALTFGGTSLIIEGTETLTVADDILMTAENKFKNTDLSVKGTATLIVNGNVSMIRTTDNNSSSWLALFLSSDSKTYFLGDFSYDYKNSGNLEFINEIYLYENALLDISGQTTLIARDGKDLDFTADGNSQVALRDSVSLLTYGGSASKITSNSTSTVEIFGNAYMLNSGGSNPTRIGSGSTGGNLILYGDLFMESTMDKQEVAFEISGSSSEGIVEGNISMSGVADSSVYMNIADNGRMKLGGSILRPTGYGALKMENNSRITFNGTKLQSVPSSHLLDANSNKDSLYFAGIGFENTSGEPISLEDNLIIQDTLFLKEGNIKTSPTALLIIEEDAIILGANKSSYIEGPILKKGSIAETEFTFPIGDAETYAPMTISNTDLNLSQYTAEYHNYSSDPPPFGVVNLSGGLTNVSQNEYWTLDKSAGSQDVNVTLHWQDAQASGISELSSLAIAGYDQPNNEWDNFGNGGTTGSTGEGNPGTIINSLASDPPPFGVTYFTYGTSSSMNSLPVELTSFHAVQQNLHVYLQWETASERNTSHFSIERSTNGIDFEVIGNIQGSGDGVTVRHYNTKDIEPGNGINYYRLKIVDTDGSFEYSNIEVVNFESTPTIQLFPNPVEKTIQLEGFDLNIKDVQLEIYDRDGRLIFSNKVAINNGQLIISTDLVNIHDSGTYFLRIVGKSKSPVLKFLKMH